MNYQTFEPHPDLQTIVKCYWTLEVPAQNDVQRQLILPDGCVDMCFILGDDIQRYTSDNEFIIQPREIPTTDLKRAISFYKAILSVEIEEAEMGDVKMGILPGETGTVSVVLANGSDYHPTMEGSLLYLNGGEDLQPILNKIEPNGGKIIIPKTQITPEMGFFALFIDTEGNKMGLHSVR